MEEIVINDLVYFKDIKIVQNKNYFNFSLDSIILPNFAIINNNTKKIIDLCSGNLPVALVLSTKTKEEITAVEIQKEIYDLGKQTLKINNLEERINYINDDVKNIEKTFDTDSFDLITCNPPYFQVTSESKKNDNMIKSIARHEIKIELDDIFRISKKILKNNSSLCIVHRSDRLSEIINKMRQYNIEPKRIRFVYPKLNKESNLVLIDGHKNAKPGLKVLPPLIVHNEDGTYTDEIIKMFKGE